MKSDIVAKLNEVRDLLKIADDTAALLSQIDFIPATQRLAIRNLRKLITLARNKTVWTAIQVDSLPPNQQWAGLSQADCTDIREILKDYAKPGSVRVVAVEALCTAGCDLPLADYLVDLVDRVANIGEVNRD